jgi:hypothetical protein
MAQRYLEFDAARGGIHSLSAPQTDINGFIGVLDILGVYPGAEEKTSKPRAEQGPAKSADVA